MSDRKPTPTDLKLLIGFVMLASVFVLLPPLSETPLRIVFGLPMVLFAPGYALIAALFPKKDDLDAIERIALSFGLSIAVVPLIGLILNYTPWGIRLVPSFGALYFFTIAMALIAIHRRESLGDDAFKVDFRQIYESLKDEVVSEQDSKLDRALSLILIFMILASVVTLVYVVVTPKQGEQFTEFYILGPEGMADNYDTQLVSGESVDVIVGIVNHEYEVVNYSLGIRIDNGSLEVPDAAAQIPLEHNETWEQRISYTPEITGDAMKLQYLLFKDGNFSEPYRDLHLWINVSEA